MIWVRFWHELGMIWEGCLTIWNNFRWFGIDFGMMLLHFILSLASIWDDVGFILKLFLGFMLE